MLNLDHEWLVTQHGRNDLRTEIKAIRRRCREELQPLTGEQWAHQQLLELCDKVEAVLDRLAWFDPEHRRSTPWPEEADHL